MNIAQTHPSSLTDAGADRPVKLACRGLWKVFGASAGSFIDQHPGATSADFAAAGLVPAVRDVNIAVGEGEIFIIMGLSGSGKSTLVRCLTRLIEPTRGEVLLEGRDLLGASEHELVEIRRHQMGMVFQNFALLPHLTVLGNIAFPLTVQGASKSDCEARARELIELVGLQGRENSYPRELSGGQQQRVGIARSLAVKPRIWFLDEPFSALDPLIRREMQAELLRLQAVLHKTILFITHDFDEAIRLADRIAIMKDGAIIQVGTPEQLVMQPATDYVAEFTRDVQRAKVISAARMMRPVAGDSFDGRVGMHEKVASFAARIVAASKPWAVTDDNGEVIGQISAQAVIDMLAGRDTPA